MNTPEAIWITWAFIVAIPATMVAAHFRKRRDR